MSESISLTLQNLFLKLKEDAKLGIEEVKSQFLKISPEQGGEWVHLFKADQAFKENNYSDSKKQALDIIKTNRNRNLLLAEANALLGRIARLHRLFEDAQNFFVKAEKLFIRENNSFGIIRMKYNKANILLINSRFPDALTQYNQILEYLDKEEKLESDKVSLKASVFQNIGIIKMYQGELPESADFFEKGKKLLISLGKNHEKSLADLLLNYANLARTIENRELLRSLLSEAFLLYDKLSNNLACKVFIDIIRDEIVFDRQIPTDPLLIDLLMENWLKVKSQETEIRMEEIATGLFELGAKESSIQLVSKILEQNVDISTNAKLLYLQAKDQFFKENYKKSIELCDRVLKICKELNDEFSATGVESTKLISNYLMDRDYFSFKEKVITNLVKKQKLKDENGISDLLSQVYGLVAKESFRVKDKFILNLIENYELPIIKRSKDKHLLKIMNANLSFVNYLYGNLEDSKKIFKKHNLSYKEILEISPFSHFFDDEAEVKTKFEEIFHG